MSLPDDFETCAIGTLAKLERYEKALKLVTECPLGHLWEAQEIAEAALQESHDHR